MTIPFRVGLCAVFFSCAFVHAFFLLRHQFLPQPIAHLLVTALLQHPVELVEMSVGLLALHRGREVGERNRVIEPGRVRVRLPDLEVRLAVQVRRLDERHALRFTVDTCQV